MVGYSTGTGNTVDFSNSRVIQLTLDSLRYWVEEFHVDGFRFDLSVTLGREHDGYDPGSGFFDALLQDPTLARVKLIAEPCSRAASAPRRPESPRQKRRTSSRNLSFHSAMPAG